MASCVVVYRIPYAVVLRVVLRVVCMGVVGYVCARVCTCVRVCACVCVPPPLVFPHWWVVYVSRPSGWGGGVVWCVRIRAGGGWLG